MIIYVSHSRQFDFKRKLYEPLQSSLNKLHSFIFPHAESDELFPTKELFESQQIELVIAEVSYASTGQGIELGWAEMLHIPIVCLHQPGKMGSTALFTVSNKFIEYLDSDDMIKKVKRVIEHLEQEKN